MQCRQCGSASFICKPPPPELRKSLFTLFDAQYYFIADIKRGLGTFYIALIGFSSNGEGCNAGSGKKTGGGVYF